MKSYQINAQEVDIKIMEVICENRIAQNILPGAFFTGNITCRSNSFLICYFFMYFSLFSVLKQSRFTALQHFLLNIKKLVKC